MARKIHDIDSLIDGVLPFTKHQVYKAIRRHDHPLPFKKSGKRLLFDEERVLRWFDSLPGRDCEL